LLICKQFGGIAIATEAPLVAISEQIRCKRGQVSCPGPTGKRNAQRSILPDPEKRAAARLALSIHHKAGDESPSPRPGLSRAVNASLTLRNWLIGFHIAEYQPIGESLTPQLVTRLLPQRESSIRHMTGGESGSGEGDH